ncbi:MAG: D-alanyl-D-alanine carboxypeptidase [Candidatus Levybacteria bacterium]|nr:D-alanyl-D-alanine carboxypeptidase [Candidatus Levybacteria bacterium]
MIKIKKLNNFLKKKKRFFKYALVSLCLSVLVGTSFFDIVLRGYIFSKKIKEFPLGLSISSYPILKSPIDPDITAKAVVVMDSDSKVLLFTKNPNLSFSMASTTKIMTALVALEYYKMDDILTIKTEKVEGVNVGFSEGEKLSFENILYAMLLPSGNDAALAVAQNYPGGEVAFVKKMNEKAKSLHLVNTNYADAIGLDDNKDYTTPLDLTYLSSAALQNKIFASIVATKTKEITDITGENKYVLNNLNKLLGVSGVNGVKTGYTTEAGQVLVTSKVEVDSLNKAHTLIIVVMDSLDRFWDTSKILYLLSENINYLSTRP